jgi:hypothetical protein
MLTVGLCVLSNLYESVKLFYSTIDVETSCLGFFHECSQDFPI